MTRRPTGRRRRPIVSPDEQAVSAFVGAAVRRAKSLAFVEACAWAMCGAAAAAGASLLTRARPVLAVCASLLAALVVLSVWFARRCRVRTSRAVVVRLIEHAEPSLRNLLVTANEIGVVQDSSIVGVVQDFSPAFSAGAAPRLHASPHARSRVFADAATHVSSIDIAAAISRSPAVRAVSVAAVVWLLVGGAAMRVHTHRPGPGATPPQQAGEMLHATGTSGVLRVTATIRPPDYTRRAAQTLVDPAQLQALEGSAVTLTITATGDRVTVAHDEAPHALTRGAEGQFTDRFVLAKTGFLVISASDGLKRIVPLVVAPDALPVVKLTAPGRDLIYSGGNPRIAFEAQATDDFGLRELVLRYTKVSGSGEQFAFKEGEIPLTINRSSARDWRGAATRSLVDLNLVDGDMLVYRAVAADARPGDGSASSDAFFIQISKLGAAAGDAFTLPEEETRYALSQQMLIVKTERLLKQQAAMPAAQVVEAALNLAVEQRMIRAEFVFMLGGEVEDEEVEAQESTELQEGRQQNRGQRDVRDATQAMSRAGKFLTGAQLTPALAAERAAVAALQRAFSKDRYILRALAARSQLDLSRRLTGDLSQASDWRRRIADVPANRRTALLQDLLQRLGALTDADAMAPRAQRRRVDPAGAAAEAENDDRSGVLLLAEQALRIDPDSAVLRQASADLQRVADTWSTSTNEGRARAIGLIAAHVADEAKKAMAAAPAQWQLPAPALRGAFADALRPFESLRVVPSRAEGRQAQDERRAPRGAR